MPRHEYSNLPTHRASLSIHAIEEMDRAFESDDEDQHGEETPLNHTASNDISTNIGITTTPPTPPGAYDFERDYEYSIPATGGPPSSSTVGTAGSVSTQSRSLSSRFVGSFKAPFFIRRAIGSILPTHYARIPTVESSASSRPHVRGSGMENDGVFANVMAKPSAPRTVQDESGNIYVMPEEAQKEAPPSYNEAQADAVPPYWETTVHAPHIGPEDDMIVDGLPSGSYFSFAWNFLISISFQFVGFVLTYLLHTTHAAKFGSRAGLGVTLIQYGLFSRGPQFKQEVLGDGEMGTEEDMNVVQRMMRRADRIFQARDWFPALASTSSNNGTMDDIPGNDSFLGTTPRDWIAFLLMTIGWLLVLTSLLGFVRVKRWEASIRAAATPQMPPTQEELARDQQLRENLSRVFGFTLDDISEDGEHNEPETTSENVRPPVLIRPI